MMYMPDIKQRFDQASHSYDSVATVQKQCAEFLVNQWLSQCPQVVPQSILDLGTGTGYIPELLLPKFPKTRLSLNDCSMNMLGQLSKKLPSAANLQFVPGDFEMLPFDFHELIISNLALQWAHDLETLLTNCFLNSNFFAFSCLLQGTFQEWEALFHQHELASPLKVYPEQAVLEAFLLSLQPMHSVFTTREFSLEFAGAHVFMRYLKQLGASQSMSSFSIQALRKMIKTSRQSLKMTYRVFFGVLVRI